MEKTIYFDTNTFYEFLSIYGFTFKCIKTGDNSKIDYSIFKNELDSLIEKQKIGLSSTILFEVITHHRKEMKELRRILFFLNSLFKDKKMILRINHNGPYFNHGLGSDEDIAVLTNYNITNSQVNLIIQEKIHSESSILGNCIYFLSMAYVLSRYGNNSTYSSIMKIFGDEMKANNYENVRLVSKHIQEEIQKVLSKAYENNCEKKSFRRIFSSSLAMGISLLLIQLDFIKNRIEKTPDATFFYFDTFGDDTKTIETICNRWNNNDADFRDKLEIFVECAKENLIDANYSQTQAEYLGSVITDLFMQKTKMDKNDASDFWILNLSRNDDYLLTFDDQMIDAIKKGNPNNFYYISSFLH